MEGLLDSDSDDDYGLGDDLELEALRKACSFPGGDSSVLVSDDSSSESDNDDFELYRNIQERFSVNKDDIVKPICVLPPALLDSDDDDNDCSGDFEILRDIQRRFMGFNKDELNESNEDGGSVVVDSEKESLDHLFSGSNVGEDTNVCEEDIGDGNQKSDVFDESILDDVASSPGRETGLPKSAHAFLDAIKKNRTCQIFLRSKLMQTESRIQENVILRNRIKALKGLQFCCRRRAGLELSQKKDARFELIQVLKLKVNAKAKEKNNPVLYYAPPENSHVKNYKMLIEKYSDSLNRNKWTKQEDINLVKGIKQQFQDMLLQKTYQNAEILRQKSSDRVSDVEGFSGDPNDLDSIIASISDHDITDENLKEFLPKVNWEQLASMYTKGRSGAECEARWLNCTDPMINKNIWTKSEEKKLLYIIQHKEINNWNWIDIAASLGTNRTPFQCLSHYQMSLNPLIMKQGWTKDEDDKLRAAIATYGESDWQCVASVLEGRTGIQCSNRWTKSLHPNREKKGKWIPNEDKRLKVAVMFFGAKNWRNVARYVPGRDHVQCRERWQNSLDPSVKLDNKWSEEEDRRLEEAFEEYGPSWNKISSYVSQRTDNQCLRRWKTLFPHEFPKLQMVRRIKKIALPSFGDREARRPALGLNDFVQMQLLDSVPEAEKMDSCGKRKRKSRKPVASANSYVAKLRSAKHKRDSQKSCEGVLRLTTENKRCSNGGKSSRQDLITSSLHKKLSVVANDDEPPTHDVHTASKKAPGGKRKKTRMPEFYKVITANTRKPSSCESECVDIQKKKVGRPRRNDATKNRKTLKPSGKKIKLSEQVNEAEVHTQYDGIDVNKKSDAIEPCLSEHSDLSIFRDCSPPPCRSPGRMLTDGDVAEPFVSDNNDKRPLRCSTPEILDNLNSRASTVSRKRHRGRNSNQMRNVGYRDGMRTQRMVLLPSGAAAEPEEIDTLIESVIVEHQRSKRLKTQ